MNSSIQISKLEHKKEEIEQNLSDSYTSFFGGKPLQKTKYCKKQNITKIMKYNVNINATNTMDSHVIAFANLKS